MVKINNEKNNDKNNKVHPITFCCEQDERNGLPIYVAIPVNHEKYPFSVRTAGSLSPVKFDENYVIKKPDPQKISNQIINSETRYKLKISDFLNHSVEIGQLWQPLLRLIDNYIKFCDHQILNQLIKSSTIANKNIKNDWNSKKHALKEIYDNWTVLMSKTSKTNKTIFKDVRSLIFKTAKIIIPLTEKGINNSCLMNNEQPLIIAWITACVSLSSVGTYTHALLKNDVNYYDSQKYNFFKNKINNFWTKFANLIKNNNRQISKDIKESLIEAQFELSNLEKETNFVESIQKYFSRSSYQKTLLVLNETNNYIKLGLKMLDFKRDALEYIFI